MKNPRLQTFQESGVMIMPLTNFSSKNTKCLEHENEQKIDNYGHKFLQCKKCYQVR